ncbi:hypothetical protein P9112_008119 [Eukaryota sp. TZLM1-RC]
MRHQHTVGVPYLISQYFKKRNTSSEASHKFQTAICSILKGNVLVGSRKPLRNKPEWVTPEVANGGFATGNCEAGGPLRPYEYQYATEFLALTDEDNGILKQLPEHDVRILANSYFLTENGLAHLKQLYQNKSYYCNTMEEAALLSFYLLHRHDCDADLLLLEQISPFFPELRFFPQPCEPLHLDLSTPNAFVYTVADVEHMLSQMEVKPSYQRKADAIHYTLPVIDTLVHLALETRDSDNVPFRQVTTVSTHLYHLLEDLYSKLPPEQRNCKRLRKGYKPFLIATQTLFQGFPDSVPDSVIKHVQMVLAGIAKKRGLPGSRQHEDLRKGQEKLSRGVNEYKSRLLSTRISLNEFIPTFGIPKSGLQAFEDGPGMFFKVIKRAMITSVQELFDAGLINSAEQLSRIANQLLVYSKISSYKDESVKYLMFQLYHAFERRRSLLLLNLEGQVRIEEVPHFQKLLDHLDMAEVLIQRQMQEFDACKLVLRAYLERFPFTQLPNKFISALKQFSINNSQLCLIPELAVDIFENGFSPNFLRAVHVTVPRIRNTLYAKYYKVDCDELSAVNDPRDLYKICERRASTFSSQSRSYTVRNGKIIEQVYILTTFNLAEIIGVFDFNPKVLARACLNCVSFLCGTHLETEVSKSVHKNAAYCFRQLLFFFSSIPNNLKESVTNSMIGTVRGNPKTKDSDLELLLVDVFCKNCRSSNPMFLGW